jgi:hypothetical protein
MSNPSSTPVISTPSYSLYYRVHRSHFRIRRTTNVKTSCWLAGQTGENMSDLFDAVFLRGVSGGSHSGYLHGLFIPKASWAHPFYFEGGQGKPVSYGHGKKSDGSGIVTWKAYCTLLTLVLNNKASKSPSRRHHDPHHLLPRIFSV